MKLTQSHTLIAIGLLLQLGAACEGQLAEDDEAPAPPSVEECADPGEVTTPTPQITATSTSDFNVQPEACELTSTALACEVGESSQFDVTSDGVTRTIVANGIANHDVDSFPNSGNPNVIAPQNHRYSVPVVPSGAGEPVRLTFGIATSGVVLEPGTAERWNDTGEWSYEALRYAGAPAYFDSDANQHPNALGVDCNFAHVQPDGKYHYHGVPTGLVPDSPEIAFVGWAADGYPIFGRWGYVDPDDIGSELVELESSYRLKEGTRPSGDEGPGGEYDGTFVQDWEFEPGLGDLDECNGRVGTVVIDGEEVSSYAYYLTYTFPYVPRCWVATPDASFAAAPMGAPPGG